MKEIREIVLAYADACRQNQKTALATVIKVEGSSYRRPGARMLVTEAGGLTGAISGGCLEKEIRRRAMFVMTERKPVVVAYDSMDDEDEPQRAVTGCNGVVHILIEPLQPGSTCNPINVLQEFLHQRKTGMWITCIPSQTRIESSPCSSFIYSDDDVQNSNTVKDDLLVPVRNYLNSIEVNDCPALKSFTCNGTDYRVFIQHIVPITMLLIVGGGNDVQPLAGLAKLLGWEVVIADRRPVHVLKARFPFADHVIEYEAGNISSNVAVDRYTVTTLMTHNYNDDLAALKELVTTCTPYIGILGPLKKRKRMLLDVSNDGFIVTNEQMQKIFGPAGLDIGAETPEEIALAIVSEIKKTLTGFTGMRLRDKKVPIHNSALSNVA